MLLRLLTIAVCAAVLEGSPAPPFALRGTAPAAARTPTLIAFLDLTEAGAERGPSRSQAEALISVIASFDGGLRAVVVDAAPTLHGRDPKLDDVVARVHEWGLDDTPVVEDHSAVGLARSYGVTATPSVFLVDPDGIVRGRWDRFVGPSELGIRLAKLRGDAPSL